MTALVLALLLAPPAAPDALEVADRLVAQGKLQAAVELARGVAESAQREGDRARQARAENLLGGARIYGGEYDLAENHYRAALDLLRELRDAKAEVQVLNNLASVWFFRGKYAEAWNSYAEALGLLREKRDEPWHLAALQLTEVNQAALLQKLGRHDDALRIYKEVRARPGGMAPAERARVLGNFGALLRRLGDPVKAVRIYREALALQPDLDTSLGVRKNLGIALAFDLDQPEEAIRELSKVAAEADRAGDVRDALQARLYAAEATRRAGRRPDVSSIVAEARQRKLPDELWKALLVQARVEDSAVRYEEAVAAIEAMRPGKRTPAPRTSFLQDRAEAYDGRIALLRRESAPASKLLFWHERLRARVLEETLGGAAPDESLAGRLQAQLLPDEALWSLRVSRGQGSAVWITRHGAQAQWFNPPAASAVAGCWSELRNPQEPAGACAALRAALPAVVPGHRVYVVSDGPLALFPFETFWGTDVQVVHLPSARGVLQSAAAAPWVWPWTHSVTALAPGLSGKRLPGDDRWNPLPFAEEEARDVATRLPGWGEIHTGIRARRNTLEDALQQALIVHVAAHAAADAEDPARARVLLADGYLYPSDLAEARFAQLRLIALSACESGLGPQVDGEGLQNWSRVFLAQGAHAALATVWRVDDRASFLLMQRFYRGVGEGLPLSEALMAAKREMAASAKWKHPHYWAGFVLTGQAGPAIRPVPWMWALTGLALAMLLMVWWRVRRGN